MRVDLHPAYILHRRPYRETSLLVEAFSLNHGRTGLVARGVRRTQSPLSAVLQPFRPLQLSWSGRGELATLTGVEPDGTAHRVPPARLASAFYLNETVVRLLHRHDPHPELYRAYAEALANLTHMVREEPVLRVFEKRLLEAAGYGLVLDHIAHSNVPVEPQTTYHYVADRGPCLAEPADSRSIPITGATLLALAAEQIEDERCLHESKKLMRFALQPHLGSRPLESRRLLDLL